jgi:peptidyl-prolyl cis-trans isomerase SurA
MNRPAAAPLPQPALTPRCSVGRAATRAGALLFVLTALVPAALAQRVELLDRIVAVVNADVITRLELDRENSIAQEALRRQGTPLPQRDVLEKQLLERLITKNVLMQYARQTGLRVTDPEVEAALERIAAENKMKSADLREAVEQGGVPFARFREDLRGELLISKLREREVEAKISVTDTEIQNFLRTQEAQPERVDEYNLWHILITVPEQASPEELKLRRGRAENALTQIRQGGDFRQAAASYSDAPDALQGGDMGWRPTGRLPTIFLQALKDMKVGQVSDIVRSPAGFHILKLNDKRGNDTPILVNQTHARHILVRLNEVVSENDARNRLGELKDRIENEADFAELARLHSDDTTAARGGDLGWVSPGDTVPEFERAMAALQPGQVSQPFKTAFGWHIVQVLERREQDMSKDRQRVQARQAIRSRKSDEQWQEWVRQQRDKAYVEYKLEEK